MDKMKFLEKARGLHGYKYEYLDLPNKIKVSDTVKVRFDGVVYYQRVIKHLNGRCPEKVIYKKTTEEFIKEAKLVWGDKYDYSLTKYEGALNNITIIYDGVIYEQRASSHLDGMAPEFRKTDESIIRDNIRLSESTGIKEIETFLSKYKFDFTKGEFDFYISSIRTAIEFDGKQHYQVVEELGGLQMYESLRVNDKIKSEYCEDEYINLIRIRYDQVDDIHLILWDNLKNHIKTKKTK